MWILLLLLSTFSHAMETYICTGAKETYYCYLYNGHEKPYLENVIHVHEPDFSDDYGNPEPYVEEEEEEPLEDPDEWVDKYILQKNR
jgi:hypothetical protein